MENDLTAIASRTERHASKPRDRAEDLVYEAWEAAGPQRAVLAREALALWPDCADGYVLLAQAASSLEEARELLERGVAAGERLDTANAYFLAERDLAPSSHRVYELALARLQDHLGADTPVGQITARRLAQFMGSSYQHLAPASWNRVVATLGSFFAYTTRQGWTGKSPATGLERRRSQTSRDDHLRRRAIPKLELTAFLDAQHPLRETTLWWLLYKTAARANEILALNVEDLDMPRRRAVVIGKGGRAELVGWETKTARLLPRHLQGRTSGPLFTADIAPPPARQPALADLDPQDRARPAVLPPRRGALLSGLGRLDASPVAPLQAHPPRRARHPTADPARQEPPHQPQQPRDLRPTHLRRRRPATAAVDPDRRH